VSSALAPRASLTGSSGVDPRPTATWLPIRRAAELLGVSVATLRLWTAAGRIQASVTPGGHRRYAEADVRRLLAEQPGTAWDQAASELVATLRARYAQLAREEVRRQAWFSSFDDAARPRVHALGEALLTQVAEFLAAPGARERAALLRGGRGIGARYGEEVARLGLTASEALEAFLFFRRPILDSVSAMARAHPGLALPAGEALAALTRFMDVVLLAMTRTYERHAAARRGAR
jgi:excisionase family DNA binding protein